MSIAVEAATHADHVRVSCAGEFSLEPVSGAFERAFALAAEAGREAALLDLRKLTGEPTMAERYELAVRVADMQAGRSPRIRLAVLGHEPLIHPERFGEIVATRRGAVARTFSDEGPALEWLLGQKRGP